MFSMNRARKERPDVFRQGHRSWLVWPLGIPAQPSTIASTHRVARMLYDQQHDQAQSYESSSFCVMTVAPKA